MSDIKTAAIIAFDDFLNEPPTNESEMSVREYRYQAYAKWQTFLSAINSTPVLDAQKVREGEILRRASAALEYMLENFDTDIPERNCSCHISPPCSDCVDYSGLREAIKNAKGSMAEIAITIKSSPAQPVAPCVEIGCGTTTDEHHPTCPEAAAQEQRCEHCDGTGDVHRADGEWLGECDCTKPTTPKAAQDHSEDALNMVDGERESGYNGCLLQAQKALRYLSRNPRPDGGESNYNFAHLLQIAEDIDTSIEHWQARVALQSQPAIKPTSLTINAAQLKQAFELAAPDWETDEDQRDTEVELQWLPERVSIESEPMEAGLYLWYTDYPEEGVILLPEIYEQEVVAESQPASKGDAVINPYGESSDPGSLAATWRIGYSGGTSIGAIGDTYYVAWDKGRMAKIESPSNPQLSDEEIRAIAHACYVSSQFDIYKFARAILQSSERDKDGERYRALRNKALNYEQFGAFTPYVVKGQTGLALDGKQLDAAVDAGYLSGCVFSNNAHPTSVLNDAYQAAKNVLPLDDDKVPRNAMAVRQEILAAIRAAIAASATKGGAA